MLLLSRKIGEMVQIDDDIHITVLGVKGHTVKLGFTAPRDRVIHRQEVIERIHQRITLDCQEPVMAD